MLMLNGSILRGVLCLDTFFIVLLFALFLVVGECNNAVDEQNCRNMGCIFSTEAVDDVGGPSPLEIPLQSGEIHVFVPGFRAPKQIDLMELLKGSVSAGLAARLHSLRSQIIAASGRKGPTIKLTRRKSADGKDHDVPVPSQTALTIEIYLKLRYIKFNYVCINAPCFNTKEFGWR